MNTAILRDQHATLLEIVQALGEVVSSGSTPKPVSALRWRLARVLMAHLAIEDQFLYPAMIASDHRQTRELAIRFRNEMGALSESFTQYMALWSDLAIADDWPGFCADTRIILAELSRRVERENNQLYPLAPSDWNNNVRLKQAG